MPTITPSYLLLPPCRTGRSTYSITQAPHGPNRTRIKVGTTSDVPGIDAFHTVDLPQIKHDEDIYPGIPLEEQYGTVKWFAPVHLAPGVKPDSIKLEGKVYMQLCDDNGCALPRDYAFTATYRPDVRAEELPKEKPAAAPAAKPAAPPVNSVPPTGSPSPVASPATPLSTSGGIVRPGVTLPQLNAGLYCSRGRRIGATFITVTLPPNLYTYSITQPSGGPIATTINVDAGSDYRLIGQFLPLTSPNVEVNVNAFPGLPLEEHAGTITWVAPIKFTPGMRPTLTQIHGSVRMQLCEMNDKGCFPPRDFPFSAALSPESKELAARGSAAVPLANDTSPRNKALKPRAAAGGGEIKWSRFTSASDLHDLVGGNFNLDAIQANVRGSEAPLSVWGAILAGFIGGLILNVMPCVLPVIGLKILSFVEQSRHNRAKAFALNVWYSAGLLTVFLVLASLAVGPQKLGWGQLFWGNVVYHYVDGCRLCDGSELHGPVGSSLAGVFRQRQGGRVGLPRRRRRGILQGRALTTLLATPCSPPFLATALVWATAQPPWLTYVVFASIGIGMASPYLVVGAFPELVRFLPKPGAWMETFKQAMGFVLMGTVVYMLTVLDPYNVVPTVGLLFALWFGCWWVGRLSPLADAWKKFRTWALAAAFSGAVWIVMFPGLPNDKLLGSYAFSGLSTIMQQRLGLDADDDLQPMSDLTGPRAVLVDFTADWCPNCHLYENTVLRSPAVAGAFNASTSAPSKPIGPTGKRHTKCHGCSTSLAANRFPSSRFFRPPIPIIRPSFAATIRSSKFSTRLKKRMRRPRPSSPPPRVSSNR